MHFLKKPPYFLSQLQLSSQVHEGIMMMSSDLCKRTATFSHMQIWKNMFQEMVWSLFTDSGHSTLESNSYTKNWIVRASWILFVSYGSHGCAACSSSPCSWRLWQLQHLRFGYVAFFPGCIDTDSLTGYCSCLKKKIREVLSWSPAFLSSYSCTLPVFVS